MNEIDLNNFNNSSMIFSYLLKNKTALTIFLADGTKLSGRLLGWDQDYFLVLYGKTLQVIPIKNMLRLQAELDTTPIVAIENQAVAPPELAKPKITPAPEEGNDIKDQIMADRIQNSSIDKPPAKDRLDHLLKNW